jgi:hypothetical protein
MDVAWFFDQHSEILRMDFGNGAIEVGTVTSIKAWLSKS